MVKAYDSARVRVTDVNNGVVGKFVFFSSKFYLFIKSFWYFKAKREFVFVSQSTPAKPEQGI